MGRKTNQDAWSVGMNFSEFKDVADSMGFSSRVSMLEYRNYLRLAGRYAKQTEKQLVRMACNTNGLYADGDR